MAAHPQNCSAAELLREFERDPSRDFKAKIEILTVLGSLMPNASEEEAASFASNIFQTIRAENVRKLPSDLEEVVKTVPTSGVLMLIEKLAKEQWSSLTDTDFDAYSWLLENVTHCDATADLLVRSMSELWIEWINSRPHRSCDNTFEADLCRHKLMEAAFDFWTHNDQELKVLSHANDIIMRVLVTEAVPAKYWDLRQNFQRILDQAQRWLSKTMKSATEAQKGHMWFLYTFEIDQEPLNFAKTLLQFEMTQRFFEPKFFPTDPKEFHCRNVQELQGFLLNLSVRIELALQRSPDHINREDSTSGFLVDALDISSRLLNKIDRNDLSSFVYFRFVALVFKCMECDIQHAEGKDDYDFASINHGRWIAYLTRVLIRQADCDATKRAIMEKGLKIDIDLYENYELPFPTYKPWVYLCKVMGDEFVIAKDIATRLLPPDNVDMIEGWHRCDRDE